MGFPWLRVQIGENSIDSVKREMMEELGIEVKVERLLWIIENFFEYEKSDYHEIVMYYLISDRDLSEIDTSPFHGVEGERLWVPIDSLGELNVYPV